MNNTKEEPDTSDIKKKKNLKEEMVTGVSTFFKTSYIHPHNHVLYRE